MKCIICGSERIQTVDTEISGFVWDRIHSGRHKPGDSNTRLCFCKDCTFAFYEYRFTAEEESLLYANYRDDVYQKQREKHECWYTKKVNDAINSSGTREQQRIITKILTENNIREIGTALDFGGNRGETFTPEIGAIEKYVYDISGVTPVAGVQAIGDKDELQRYHYDFVMCNMVFEHLSDPMAQMRRLSQIGDRNTVYYIEVPSENPFLNGNKFSILKNMALLLNPNYSWWRLARYFVQQRRGPFMPMKEHVNFFTVKSIRTMIEKSGFVVMDVQENIESTPLGKATVLSVLFRKQEG